MVMTDRAEGGTSLNNGAIDLMIQRLIKTDDNRGMAEGITRNEPVVIQHTLIFINGKKKSK